MSKKFGKIGLNAGSCRTYVNLFFFFSILAVRVAQAQDQHTPTPPDSHQPTLLAFRENGIVLETGRTIPTYKSLRSFSAGYKPGKRLVYRRVLEQDWMAAIGFGFKEWNLLEFETPMSIFTIDHEIHRLIRINHPMYLAVGVRTSFMVPALNDSIPPKRYSGYDSEVGVAASMQLIGRITTQSTWNLRFERWRGTKTSRLHAYEIAAGVGIDFESKQTRVTN